MKKWNYDYSQTFWMKMFLAIPDYPNRRSKVFINFEQALEIIKAADILTRGVPKIVYLVGWQGLGHDDCFPEMDVINEALKRDCDASARESLYWLYEEAKKYNTVVSFHGNLSDAYTETPSFPELAAANALVNDVNGDPAVIEVFNGRDAYKVSYKGYYESGLFKRQWDSFCEATPVRESGTVHLDNFCLAQSLNPRTSLEEEDEARNRMLDYISSLGIDVTTEYTYREQEWRADTPEHPIRKLYATAVDPLPVGRPEDAPIRTLGRIAASWWTSSLTAQDCLEVSPYVYSGRITDTRLLEVFYGAVHGEDIWMDRGWEPQKWHSEFLHQFCTMQLPYFYLNRQRRLSIEPDGDGWIASFSDGVRSIGRSARIEKDGKLLKDGTDVLLPLSADNRTFMAYSEKGKKGEWDIPDAAFTDARIFRVTLEGSVPAGEARINGGRITLECAPGETLRIEAADR